MMTSTMYNNVIQAHGSPMSPRSIFKVQSFEGKDKEDLRTKVPFPPTPILKEESRPAPQEEEEEVTSTSAVPREEDHSYTGCSPYIGTFFIKPSQNISDPIFRAMLSLDPTAAMRVCQSYLEDVLVNCLGLVKSNTSSDSVFEGYLHGHRIALAEGDDTYALCCSDEDIAREFLVLLRSFDIQVEQVKNNE